MKKIVFSFIFLMLVFTSIFSQTTPEKKPDASNWGIKFSGFVRNDVFYDSRQVVSVRPAAQDELLLYPSPVSKEDANGTDINAAPSLSLLAIATRLTGTITGPGAFGAKTSGFIEAEFFGNTNGNENSFRLRHAYAKLDWSKTQLAFGQYWHPLFVTDCYPGTVSFNTGIPFQPFARNPQIRLTQKLGKEVNLIVAAVSQIEAFTSPGSSTNYALGASSAASTYAVNAVLPNLHAQLQYKGKLLLLGAAIDYKSLRPALKDSTGGKTYSTSEKVNSVSFEAYGKLTTRDIIVKAEYVAGQNLYDQLMFGGYFAYGSHGNVSYKPDQVNAGWIDIAGTGKKIVPGLFIGYAKNDGASSSGAIFSYTRGVTAGAANSIDNVLRVSPRMEFVSGKFKFGTEIEITSAAYGAAGTNGKVTGSITSATNTRLLLTTTYSF